MKERGNTRVKAYYCRFNSCLLLHFVFTFCRKIKQIKKVARMIFGSFEGILGLVLLAIIFVPLLKLLLSIWDGSYYK